MASTVKPLHYGTRACAWPLPRFFAYVLDISAIGSSVADDAPGKMFHWHLNRCRSRGRYGMRLG